MHVQTWPHNPALNLTSFNTKINSQSDPNWNYEKSLVNWPGDMIPPNIKSPPVSRYIGWY